MPLRAKHASVIGAGSITAWEKRPGACPHDDAPSLPAIPPTTHPGSAGRYGRFQQPQAELLPGREIAFANGAVTKTYRHAICSLSNMLRCTELGASGPQESGAVVFLYPRPCTVSKAH